MVNCPYKRSLVCHLNHNTLNASGDCAHAECKYHKYHNYPFGGLMEGGSEMLRCRQCGSEKVERVGYEQGKCNECGWIGYPDVSQRIGDISLRDWFAGMALSGFYAFHGAIPLPKTACKRMYMIADAMMEARKEEHMK